jgi:hypothetical protein
MQTELEQWHKIPLLDKVMEVCTLNESLFVATGVTWLFCSVITAVSLLAERK